MNLAYSDRCKMERTAGEWPEDETLQVMMVDEVDYPGLQTAPPWVPGCYWTEHSTTEVGE